jgi:hypothetical protein
LSWASEGVHLRKVGVVPDELDEVLKIITIKFATVLSIACGLCDNVTGSWLPKLEGLIEGAFGDLTAEEDVLEGKELALKEPNGCKLDVAADSTVHGCYNTRKILSQHFLIQQKSAPTVNNFQNSCNCIVFNSCILDPCSWENNVTILSPSWSPELEKYTTWK